MANKQGLRWGAFAIWFLIGLSAVFYTILVANGELFNLSSLLYGEPPSNANRVEVAEAIEENSLSFSSLRLSQHSCLKEDQRQLKFITEQWIGEHISDYVSEVDSISVYMESNINSVVVNQLQNIKGKEFLYFNGFDKLLEHFQSQELIDNAFIYDKTRHITVSSGVMVAVEDTELDATDYGTLYAEDYGDLQYLSRDHYYNGASEQKTLSLKQGEQIELLQYSSEGFYFLRKNGHVISTQLVGLEDVSLPETELWIRLIDVSTNNRQPIGWILVEKYPSDTSNLEVQKRFQD